MRNAVVARPVVVEPVEHKGLSVVESLARAARQIALYGPEHPIAARALQDAWRDISAETTKQEIVLEVEEDCLLWNGQRERTGSAHLQRLHEGLRERLVASVRFTARLDPAGLSRLLLILAEDSKLLISSGGVMRAYGPEGPPGVLVEDLDFAHELRECEASWVEMCEEVDPEAVAPLREILESCLHIVRSTGEDQTLDQMRETLAAEDVEDDDVMSPIEAIASTIAAMVQSAGEIVVHLGSARRQAWENSILRQFGALGPRWGAYIFRAPTVVTPGSSDILALLAQEMEVDRCLALILDYPGGIVTERSEGLSLALRRILSGSSRAARIERELHHQATSRGISEQVYRNVVGMLMPQVAEHTRSEGTWRLPDGGEEPLQAEDPRRELAHLLETTALRSMRRSRAAMLLDLLNEEMNASQYSAVIKALLEMAERSTRLGDLEMLVTLLERLEQEANEAGARSSGRRAIAASALARGATREVISALVHELERSTAEPRGQMMRLLSHLGEEGMAALLARARRTQDVDSAEALQVLVQQDGPAFSHLRQLLSDLPLGDLPAALRTLQQTRAPLVLAQLGVLVSRSEPEARMALLRVLTEEGSGAGSELAIRLLSDPEPGVRAAAADTLGRLRAEDAVAALCYLLGRESSFGRGARVKAAAARALGEIRSSKAIPSLSVVLFGGGLLTRFIGCLPQVAAAEALGKIGTAEAREAMGDWQRCTHYLVREACQRALRGMPGAAELNPITGGRDVG